jgi:hypothetical protein
MPISVIVVLLLPISCYDSYTKSVIYFVSFRGVDALSLDDVIFNGFVVVKFINDRDYLR